MPTDALTPQARHHFTRFDQVDQLVSASEAESELAFMHRLMALCSLPRTDPGDAKEFTRVNGPVALGMGVRSRLRQFSVGRAGRTAPGRGRVPGSHPDPSSSDPLRQGHYR